MKVLSAEKKAFPDFSSGCAYFGGFIPDGAEMFSVSIYSFLLSFNFSGTTFVEFNPACNTSFLLFACNFNIKEKNELKETNIDVKIISKMSEILVIL